MQIVAALEIPAPQWTRQLPPDRILASMKVIAALKKRRMSSSGLSRAPKMWYWYSPGKCGSTPIQQQIWDMRLSMSASLLLAGWQDPINRPGTISWMEVNALSHLGNLVILLRQESKSNDLDRAS